jgi:hypothetical protein
MAYRIIVGNNQIQKKVVIKTYYYRWCKYRVMIFGDFKIVKR